MSELKYKLFDGTIVDTLDEARESNKEFETLYIFHKDFYQIDKYNINSKD